MIGKRLTLIAVAAALAACSNPNKRPPGDNEPTLASLRDRTVAVAPDQPGATPRKVAEEQTIAAYKEFLASAPKAPQRPEAMRRLGDLEMDKADRTSAEGASDVPDYKAAIARYEDYLKAHPQDARNDRVLYQLARAQESNGQLEESLKTLSMLVKDHPGTIHADEPIQRGRSRLRDRAECRQPHAVYRTRAVHAGLVVVQAGADRRCVEAVFWCARSEARRPEPLGARRSQA
jgi:cellulose synthase operon protein C